MLTAVVGKRYYGLFQNILVNIKYLLVLTDIFQKKHFQLLCLFLVQNL